MDALGDQLAVIDVCPGILQVDPSGAQAFDLGAYQLDACFQCSMTKYSWRTSRLTAIIFLHSCPLPWGTPPLLLW